MSMIRCERCSSVIDTDDDPECFVQVGEDAVIRCEPCRDKMEAEHDAEMNAARRDYDAAPLSERNPSQYRQDMIDAGRGHLLPPESVP